MQTDREELDDDGNPTGKQTTHVFAVLGQGVMFGESCLLSSDEDTMPTG